MELRNDFRVALPLEPAWRLLNDVERIAPCLPGAQLQEIEEGEFRGLVKVKVGPVTAQYKGKAVLAEQDEPRHRLVLTASGRENGDGGHANATVTASLVADGEATLVNVVIDLAITGKLAQLGQGVLSEVSANLLGQFASCLEHQALVPVSDDGGTAAGPEPAALRRIAGPEVEPVDLFQAAGRSLAKRAVPILAAVVLTALIVVLWRRRTRP